MNTKYLNAVTTNEPSKDSSFANNSAPIAREIHALIDISEELEKAIAVLGQRLLPVLAPIDATPMKDIGVLGPMSELTQELVRHKARIRTQIEAIQSLTARCEL